jgi:hypothetical protein
MVEFHQILFDEKVCKNGIIGIPMHFELIGRWPYKKNYEEKR